MLLPPSMVAQLVPPDVAHPPRIPLEFAREGEVVVIVPVLEKFTAAPVLRVIVPPKASVLPAPVVHCWPPQSVRLELIVVVPPLKAPALMPLAPKARAPPLKV